MDKFLIQGGTPLEGEIAVSGAEKFGAAGAGGVLLTAEKVMLGRIPTVRDIRTMEKLLAHTGASVRHETGGVIVEAARSHAAGGSLRAGQNHARVEPGAGPFGGALRTGAGFAARRMRDRVAADQSARLGLEQLGATVRQEHGYIEAAGSEWPARRGSFASTASP